MACGVPNLLAFLKKLDARIISEGDVEISDTGDMLLTKMKGVEAGDLFVVRRAFTEMVASGTGVQFSPCDVGIVKMVDDDTGNMQVIPDKDENAHWIYSEQFGNLRLVPKGLRQQFRKEHSSGYKKTFDEEQHGVADITEEMNRVDEIIANAEAFFDKVLETGRAMNAIETAWSLRENLRTYVLATLMAPGCHSSWASGIPSLVASHSRFCSNLTMIAVKGGRACDKEIEFIIALVPKMGFEVVYAAKRNESKMSGLMALSWRWKRKRTGAEDYVVNLEQFQNVEFAGMIKQDMAPEAKHCQAPNLKRLAVVSAPVDDKWRQAINERLNVLLLKMLDGAATRAAKKGFLPVAMNERTKSEEHSRIYREYFDLPPSTLASRRIKCTA